MPGQVSLVFDDGYADVYTKVVPFLDDRAVPATFAVPLDSSSLTWSAPVTSVNDWQRINHQHELAAHGVSHRDLTSLSNEILAYELNEPVERLGATTLVYPGGSFNESVRALAAETYVTARSTIWGIESRSPRNTHALRTINWTSENWSLLKANLYVAWAALTDRWLIETFHLVTDEPHEYGYTVPLADFKRHIGFIQRVPIDITTVKDALA